MIINLTAIPTKWDGSPLGVTPDNEPRALKPFLLQSLAEAQIAVPVPGAQRGTESPEALLKRFMLASKIQAATGSVDVTSEEFQLLEKCIASLFKEAASVQLIGLLHESVGAPKHSSPDG